MTFLVRIELDAGQSIALGLTDSYAWHQRLWDCFAVAPDQRRDFLSRIDPGEGMSCAWLLAERQPVRPAWCPPESFAVKEVAPSFLAHRHYAFDLRANPVKALVQREPDGQPLRRADGRRRSGKRVPLIKQEDLRAWLARKALAGGFRIDDRKPLEIGPVVEAHFRKKEHAGYHGGVVFRGVLEVTNAARFAQTYKQGIGSAKGFGFGLLLLAPINP